MNETIEVCAPVRIIVGKRRFFLPKIHFQIDFINVFTLVSRIKFIFPGKTCAEYNSGGKTIQRHFKVDCKECPDVYSSDKSFLCK